PNQQWRFLTAREGWLQIEARHSGKVLDTGACESGGSIRQASRLDQSCQHFRLQPVEAVKLINANSGRVVAVDEGGTADGADVVLWSDTGTAEQQWRFTHQENGFYQVVASHSTKCLAVSGNAMADGADVIQSDCTGDTNQQWRSEPLNDGTVRLVAREGGKVLDAANCRMGDGTDVQQWSWLDNLCQRFRVAVP
ncbi:MAG TPA: RICIN domain-containing protein, partial [Ardenticatenaceae bacterium]|nr:RICIN domain-containing protein [Ardenticatenaceae bacterium]